MHIDELCSRFRVGRRTIHYWRRRGIVPPPYGRNRSARWGREHVEAISAYLALKHANVSIEEALRLCKEDGISLTEFVSRREESIRLFGLNGHA